MKKFYLAKIVILFVVLMATNSVFMSLNLSAQTLPADEYAGGTGVLGDPWLISNAAELQRLRAFAPAGWEKHFKLTADIDMTGEDWAPLKSSGLNFFHSHIDGNGHVISNLTIEVLDGSANVGFISDMRGGVKNLGLIDVTVNAPTSSFVAALVGWGNNNALRYIENCYVSGGTITGLKNVAALVGFLPGLGTYRNCFADVDIVALDNKAGGLFGALSDNTDPATFDNFAFYGTVALGPAATGTAVGAICPQFNAPGGVKVSIAGGNFYYDATVAVGIAGNEDATPLDAAALKLEASYTGFDFASMWKMYLDKYAVLSIFPDPLELTSPTGGEVWNAGTSQDITWSTNSDFGTGTVDIEYTTNGTDYTVIATGETNDGSYTWAIPTDLTASATYQIRISDDKSSIIHSSESEVFEILVDVDPPVPAILPGVALGSVAIDIDPTVDFGEVVLKADGTALTDGDDVASFFTFTETATPANTVAFTATITGNVATIVPAADLNYSTGYTLTVLADVVEDVFGNQNLVVSADFTTEVEPDIDAPVATFVPATDAIDIAVDASVTITFNEDVVKSGDGSSFTENEDITAMLTFTETATPANTVTFTAAISGGVITIVSATNLANDMSYTVTLLDNMVKDAAGNITAATSTTFTTVEAAVTVSNKIIDGEVKVYPNPATDHLNIVAPDGSEIIIYNMLGSAVEQISKTSGMTIVNTSEIPAGIYLIKFSREQWSETTKIQIQ